jgi:hypothetical protein
LKNNGNDNSDNSDDISATLTGDHVCAHCGGVGGTIGVPGRVWTVAGRDAWLHDRCEAAYYDAHAGDPPPAEPPEDGPPW